MALSAGIHLGVYEILALVGAGGMGEVYRARDTRLNRTVAIKILPASIAANPQRRERFEREARAISSLSHPHICALYDIGEAPNPDPTAVHDTIRFLVLEYLEGRTLAERLNDGPLPPADALRHAIAICGALDKVHCSGIVHRDLKPANIMLTKAGAKLFDFGLAKNADPTVAVDTVSMLPITPSRLTVEGAILGTLLYMAPEQVEGLEADARTDIFAFGALLFEMLTGRTAFEGKTRGSLLSAILRDEPPPVSQIQPVVPSALNRVICTCLAKDPDERYQSARDLSRDLAWVATEPHDIIEAPALTSSARSSRVAWLVAALASIALIVTAVIALRRDARDVTPAASPAQFTIAPPESASFGGPPAGGTGTATQVAVSPDGRNVVFVAGTPSAYMIWLRPVATLAASPIAGTEGGAFPFWSPDSRFIGFFAAGKLKKVPIAGGPPIVLCDAPLGRGGSWSRSDVILASASPGSGLVRVSAAGGATTVVTTLDPATGETNHRWPYFLPDGHHFFYTASTGPCCPATKPSTIRVGSLDPGETTVTLLQTESSVSYASRHLVFARDQTLMAQPFDPDARKLTGDAFPLAEHVSTEGSRYVGASVSENGTLVYAQDSLQTKRRLTWFDRAGRILDTLGEAAPYINLALSPDERRVAVALRTGTSENPDIWTIDIARKVRSRLTIDPEVDQSPLWSADGTRIAFEGRRSGKVSLRQRWIDGTATDESLLDGQSNGFSTPTSWSADGRFIAYTLTGAFPLKSDVWVLPLFGDRKPFPLTQTDAFLESSGVFSPDGRWIAYTTDESGQPNISVQPFLRPGGEYPISRNGGSQPVWRADGKELFYLGADGTMMAVSVNATDQFVAGVPQALFPTGIFLTGLPIFNRGWVYAVTKDGQRFLVNARLPEVAPLIVVLNWTSVIH